MRVGIGALFLLFLFFLPHASAGGPCQGPLDEQWGCRSSEEGWSLRVARGHEGFVPFAAVTVHHRDGENGGEDAVELRTRFLANRYDGATVTWSAEGCSVWRYAYTPEGDVETTEPCAVSPPPVLYLLG